MDKTVYIQNIDSKTLELQTYSPEDQNLISNFDLENTFTSSVDYVEYIVYDFNKTQLLYIDNFKNYSILNNKIQLTPKDDLTLYGFEEGQYITNYNFFKNILGSSPDKRYFISEISADRTEIRLDTNTIDNKDVIEHVSNYVIQLEQSSYYKDFNLNIGNNQVIIANNILLDNSSPNNPTVLIKLYEPLPNNFDLKTELWAVETITDPLAYQINIIISFDNLDNNIQLKGPNFNLNVKDKINNSIEYTSYSNLTNTNSQPGTSSLQYQLNSLLVEKGLEINIDYSDYSNFVFFSSAQTRIENFYYKVSLIEEYQLSASYSSGSSSGSYHVSSSYDLYQNKINNIITNFDGYEYYLYFESGSKTWPKTNNIQPYINAYSTSSIVQNWLEIQYISASNYDNNLNSNNLINTIPNYLKEDPSNSQYKLFVEMMGQHFDSIWVYIKDITNKYNADNRLDYGVSKDLIADVLRDLGIKIYQNNFSTNDLYSSFLGITPNGSLLPITGSELINTYITASDSNIPLDDVNKSIYKRIYHNLPLLFKKKGTLEGLRALITLYGIPDTIIRINEFGGKNKDNTNDWDQWQNQYNYKFDTLGNNYITSSFILNSKWGATNNVPNAITFRFKTDGIPSSPSSQSLWSTNSSALILKYTGSGYTSSSYSGSNINPYYQYGTITLFPDTANLNNSASIYMPFFNDEWWSILINSGSNGYELIAKNKINNGYDGNQIGFQASSSKNSVATWTETTSYLGLSGIAAVFTGSFQELRFYTSPLSQEDFDEFVVNPSSIESSEKLAFRAPLGNDLYIYSSSLHPKVSGSWNITSSFVSNSLFHFNTNPTFSSNTEFIFLNQFPSGIKNIVNNKVKIFNSILPSGDTLSPYISIQQDFPISGSYTKDLNLLEVALSPQNEINQDIINQLGYFELGEYIGDPRQLVNTNNYYTDLNTLKNNYFEKYKHNYNLNDYIRLIKYFDNSLFKMIKDFVPARTSLSTGIVIKQHLLERNRYRVPSSSFDIPYYTGSILSFPYNFSATNVTSNYTSSLSLLFTTSSRVSTTSSLLYYNFPTNYDNIYTTGTFFNNSSESINIFVVYYPAVGSPIVLYSDNLISNPGGTNAPFNITSSALSGSQIAYITSNSSSGVTISADLRGEVITVSTTSSKREFTQLYKTIGDSAGSMLFNELLTQSWDNIISTPLGLVNKFHNDKSEYFNGELKGSTIICTTQSLSTQPLNFKLQQIGNDLGGTISPLRNIDYKFYSDQNYYLEFTLTNNDAVSHDISLLYQASIDNNILRTFTLSAGESIFVNGINIINSPLKTLTFFDNFGSSDILVSNISILQSTKLPNPLLNNISSYPLSIYYKDVDYTSNKNIPVNQQVILSGSSTSAPVKDYYYNLNRHILPRYKGSKLIGSNYNTWENGDISYGKEPVINLYQTYFLTFKELRGTYPEIINKTAVWINSLVDQDGNQLMVDKTGSNYYYNLIDNFGKDSEINLHITSLPNGLLSTNVDQNTTIFKPASLWPKVILTNETGSTMDSTGKGIYYVSDMHIKHTRPNDSGSFYISNLWTSNLWSVGNNTRNILTSSVNFADMLGEVTRGEYNVIQDNSLIASGGYGGYDSAIQFNITPYQEIRFLQNEKYLYTIISSSLHTDGTAHLFLSDNIANEITGSLNNGFLIREYQIDPSRLIINISKLSGGAPGYIIPKYMPPNMVTNFDKIVASLKKDGIL